MFKTYLTFLTIYLVKVSSSARILGVVFTPNYSHQLTFQPIWKELSLRGHQVTVLTTNPMNNPLLINLTEIDLSMSYDIMKKHKTDDLLSNPNESAILRIKKYMEALHEVADQQLSHPQVQDLIKHKRNDFDLLMVEAIHPTHMALSWWFQIPFIGLISLDAPSRIHSAVGNPVHPVLYPDYNLPYDSELSFSERLISTIFQCFIMWYDEYRLHPKEEITIKKYFGDNAPKINEIQKNMSLLFLNTNPIFHTNRPVGPTTIQIGGGLHLQKSEPLPKHIQDFLDSSKNGFIYFSLGTNVKSSALNNSTIEAIVEALSELPYNILWKFETEAVFNIPENVKILRWVPQSAVLAHKNIKAFITQCGLQSVEEAISFSVPMIGMPFYGDQARNGKILEAKKFGLIVDHKTLRKDEFIQTILKVVSTVTIKDNIEKANKLLQDLSMSGLDKAIWWTEYVIRHQGADHLKPPGIDVPLYQYLLLDVIIFISLVFILIFFMLKILFKILTCRANKVKRE